MISVPNTPFGRAFLAYLEGYTHRPLDQELLRARYAELAVFAAQERPELPWPLVVNANQPYLLSVDDLLARPREPYASMPALEQDQVARIFARWQGARVREVVAGSGMRYLFEVHLVRKRRPRQPKLRGRRVARLHISCSWQLGPPLPCSSRDTEARVVEALSSLNGATLDTIHWEANAGLVLVFSTGARLEVRPDDLLISLDYMLEIGHQPYYRYAGAFRVEERKPRI